MDLVFLAFFFIQILSTSGSSYVLFHNVIDYGATIGGSVDSTDAFLQAWKAACASKEQSGVFVPDGEFLVGICIFSGPCQSTNIGFQNQGTIIAPIDESNLMKSLSWLVFDSVNDLDIYGGKINARANSIWKCKRDKNKKNCQSGARSFTVRKGRNIKVHGLTSLNSNQAHIQIESCNIVHVSNFAQTLMEYINISTGDDCIAIIHRTVGLYVKNCKCGPGHGISIGSLGKYESKEDIVKNIKVEDVILKGTQNGVRIKTWAKGTSGLVQNITFHNITMQDVYHPIVIDQRYCPNRDCLKPVPSMIQIKNISYSEIIGTSSSELAIKLQCSESKPCDIKLANINLTPSTNLRGKKLKSSCDNVEGSNQGVMFFKTI
ncbi:Polygalacturonase, family GH28 [Zostera marina]|uniref:Polygalacturonase, family GH28 n=1 Tax=Zostera marina TaxID=29655 RepID=A0A0K9NSW6_ZOSMR|nr:Polygalacturonase, family GH28 [Zostera marina]